MHSHCEPKNLCVSCERDALRAEVAALREEFSAYVTRSSDDWMAVDRELHAARALLARVTDALEPRIYNSEQDMQDLTTEARAFLDPSRDEGPEKKK